MAPEGRKRMRRSPPMLAMALAYQNAVRLIQWPTPLLSQRYLVGQHWKAVAKMLARP